MTLFDAAEFVDGDSGSWRCEVWTPVGQGWLKMDGLTPGRWTFTSRSAAIDAAWAWVESGVILHPCCRVVDNETDEVVWVSSVDMQNRTADVRVKPQYL